MPTYRLLSPYMRMMPGRNEEWLNEYGDRIRRHLAVDPIRFEVGDLIEPTAAELQAFGDRMEWVSDDPLTPPAIPTQATRINPELFALIRRAHAGEATADEQQMVGDVMQYLQDHAQGTTSADQTAALELVLKDFGMPLFVV